MRKLIILAGFPYHKSPHVYQWLWVFILLPFLPEDTLNELSEKHGNQVRKLYRILVRYPQAFQRLLHLLSMPLFFELLKEFGAANHTAQSRHRIKIIIDDTKAEKFGRCMEFIHKLFDHTKDRYIMGYNYVLVLVVSGNVVFPLSIMLWLPDTHPDHRSKNDMVCEFINTLKADCDKHGYSLNEVELLFDSAYCKQKVMNSADKAGLRLISKPGNTYKFKFEDELLTPNEIIEKVKDRVWKFLEQDNAYQRLIAQHHIYGQVVLVVRRRRLKNDKITYDMLICNKLFYNAVRIHMRYKNRWEIELNFKYYKQFLSLGKSQFRKLGSIRSHLYCVALAGLVVTLFRRQATRKISFRKAVKLITQELQNE